MSDETRRIDDLEVRIAYQDQAIEDLNATITKQWKTIEMLTRKIARLEDELAESEIAGREATARERPPPHY